MSWPRWAELHLIFVISHRARDQQNSRQWMLLLFFSHLEKHRFELCKSQEEIFLFSISVCNYLHFSKPHPPKSFSSFFLFRNHYTDRMTMDYTSDVAIFSRDRKKKEKYSFYIKSSNQMCHLCRWDGSALVTVTVNTESIIIRLPSQEKGYFRDSAHKRVCLCRNCQRRK